MKKYYGISILACVAPLLFGSNVSAATLFTDDFESDLSQWSDVFFNQDSAQIVADPLNASNNVLNFSKTGFGGDLTSALGYSSAGNSFILSFDYLGTCGNPEPGCGGFAGVGSTANGGATFWVSGSSTAGGAPNDLLDTGAWEHVDVAFNGFSTTYIILQDFNNFLGSAGIPEDAYFDNIVLTDASGPSPVPVPSAIWLFGSGFLGLINIARRKA
ncbi:MAG: hypothetical protein QM504_09640 [Pseudomonadota bacterium]